MKIWQKTDQGVVRKDNQDFCMIKEIGAYTVGIVCDGMGGAKAGAIASQMAVTIFIETLEAVLNESLSAEEITKAGYTAINQANMLIYQKSKEDEACRGMGTTLVAVICHNCEATVFNVGDSRAYLINSSGIHAITRDHSLVQDMLENGDITEEEARRHPNRNLITRALGTEENVRADVFYHTLVEGDYFLLCSDGLINTVNDQEILYEVIHDEREETCLDRLIAISVERGAPDNVTAVLMKCEKEAEG